jgi:hypothetical protein
MEQLLHFSWKHKIFPLTGLKTTDGETIEVIDAGFPNSHAGPDFFNAKLKIGDVLWVGNVEIHEKASSWYSHGHHLNPAYGNVILHVVGEADAEVTRYGSTDKIPQLVLVCPDEVKRKYQLLKRTDAYPACYSILRDIPKITLHSWLTALQAERFDQKALLITERLHLCNGNWEQTLFISLARNFGFGLNGDAFEGWAKRIDLAAVGKHRDNILQVEAIFFGMAGLLEQSLNDPYFLELQKEYRYLSHKFNFQPPLKAEAWKLLRIRPQAFPHTKIAQLAYLYQHQEALFSKMMETKEVEAAKLLLQTSTSPYWQHHYLFGKETGVTERALSDNSLCLLLINTVIPFLLAYGKHKGNDELCYRASDFLDKLQPENNYIIRQWDRFGIHADNAADSQALIQLRKEYCDKRDCLRCRIGYQYLKEWKS